MDLAWELDIWGRLRDSQFSSRMDAEQAAANLQAARLSLAANTAKGWFDLAETELQTQLAIQTHQSYTNNLAVLEEGLQRGLTKALDVRLMRTSAQCREHPATSASANAMPPGGHLRFCWAVIPKAKSP